MPPNMLTVAEAAAILGLKDPNRVRVFIREGRLKATPFGRQYAIDPKDLETFAAIERRPGRKKLE